MKPIHLLFIVSLLFITGCRRTVEVDKNLYKKITTQRVKLSNGWSLTPVGRSLNLDDLPLNMVVSQSQKLMAITNNGQSTQSLMLIDPQTEKVLDQVSVDKSWVGLAFSSDEKFLYASGGNDNKILVYKIENKKLVADSSISLGAKWPNRISPAGLCVDDAQHRLYVTAKDNSTLYVCDTKERIIKNQLKLPAEPYTCVLSANKKELYVSLWGGAKVLVVNTETLKILAEIPTNKNPNDLLLTKDGKYLYTANGNDNTVTMIDVAKRQVAETLTASLYPNAPVGSTPNGLALSADENTLLIANADNNCLAVFDVTNKGRSRSVGFVPTGWYPTAVRVVNNKIFVANGKGFTTKANPKGPNPVFSKKPQVKGPNPEANDGESQYIGGLFKGTLSMIDWPNAPTLEVYSKVVYENTPYNKDKELLAEGEAGNPIPMRVGEASPIKYVFYIIKENRTYDQVLGDIKEGNGDASLCIFPEKTTPNQHALAREFVLLDNFYVDAEVSADGHNWSSAAYANDYVEKNWVTSYGGRGGTYDYEGQKTIAHPRNGFLWDYCKRAGVSFRTYGWFVESRANLPVLEGNYCADFKGYNLGYMDIDRERVWEKDFDELLKNNKVPRLSTLRFSNDHTSGARLGLPTPEAAVGDNDLAVGRLVEHLARSPIWKESVVFILEDDAQNGPDHVDAHRSTAYMAGGMVKRKFIDHTMYSTSSMLRTIELILGIPPMSQYDAAAVPMYRCFTNKINETLFTAKGMGINIYDKNTAHNFNSRRSEQLDFTRPDAIDDLLFSEIVWQTVKNTHTPMPSPRRAAFVKIAKKNKDDDDDDNDDD
jgi:YVTN family beta-propeller protein